MKQQTFSDIETSKLIRGDDEVVYDDSRYSGADKRGISSDEHLSKVEFCTSRRPFSIKISASYEGANWDKQIENQKSSTRCKVEYSFLIVKKQFGYAKVVYRGIAHEPFPYPVCQHKSGHVCKSGVEQGFLRGISAPIL